MGKIKGPLPKFWNNAKKIELLLVFSLMIWDMKLNELYLCFVFDGWPLLLFCPCMMLGCFWWFKHIKVYWSSFWPFRSLPNEFPKLDPSFPKLGPFPPYQGLLSLTPFLSYFFLSESSIMMRMSMRVYLLIDKFLFICLIGFWGLWLFNFPRFVTLTFST